MPMSIVLHRFYITCILDLTEVRYDMTCEREVIVPATSFAKDTYNGRMCER